MPSTFLFLAFRWKENMNKTEYMKKWRKENPDYFKNLMRRWRKKHPIKNRRIWKKSAKKHRKLIKHKVLKHYGKHGKLMCKWRGCCISDIDMLSIDHINDDGAKHRKSKYKRRDWGRINLYETLVKKDFPEGYQTLCMNHQFKKQALKNLKEQ